MINWNLITTETKNDFARWYSTLSVTRPMLKDFLTMPIQFQLGLLIEYCVNKGFLPLISTIGYKIRKYPLPVDYETNPNTIIDFEVYEEISFTESAIKAVQCVFKLIDNPF